MLVVQLEDEPVGQLHDTRVTAFTKCRTQCLLDARSRAHGVFAHEGVIYVTDSENHRVRALEGVL